MNICQNWKAKLVFYFLQHRQTSSHSWTTKRGSGGAICLIKTGLKDVLHAEFFANCIHCFCNFKNQIAIFDYAWPSNQGKWLAATDRDSVAYFC